MIAAGPNGSAPVMNVSWCSMGTGYEFGHGSNACTVGYSIVALFSAEDPADASLEGEYRHTQWVGFNTPGHHLRHDWSDSAVIRTNVLQELGSSAELSTVRAARAPSSTATRAAALSSSTSSTTRGTQRWCARCRSGCGRGRRPAAAGASRGSSRTTLVDPQPDLLAEVGDCEQPHRPRVYGGEAARKLN